MCHRPGVKRKRPTANGLRLSAMAQAVLHAQPEGLASAHLLALREELRLSVERTAQQSLALKVAP